MSAPGPPIEIAQALALCPSGDDGLTTQAHDPAATRGDLAAGAEADDVKDFLADADYPRRGEQPVHPIISEHRATYKQWGLRDKRMLLLHSQ